MRESEIMKPGPPAKRGKSIIFLTCFVSIALALLITSIWTIATYAYFASTTVKDNPLSTITIVELVCLGIVCATYAYHNLRNVLIDRLFATLLSAISGLFAMLYIGLAVSFMTICNEFECSYNVQFMSAYCLLALGWALMCGFHVNLCLSDKKSARRDLESSLATINQGDILDAIRISTTSVLCNTYTPAGLIGRL
jgi:hypothetical protein